MGAGVAGPLGADHRGLLDRRQQLVEVGAGLGLDVLQLADEVQGRTDARGGGGGGGGVLAATATATAGLALGAALAKLLLGLILDHRDVLGVDGHAGLGQPRVQFLVGSVGVGLQQVAHRTDLSRHVLHLSGM